MASEHPTDITLASAGSVEDIPRVLVLSAPDELPAAWHLFTAVQWIVPAGVEPTANALRWLPDVPLWAAFRFPPDLSADDALRVLERWSPYAERFVLDTYHPRQLGGTGATHDWRRAAAICQGAPKPVMLAGGLTPENVAQAVQIVQPAGVDVSSGVEAEVGRKDPVKLQAFIANVRTAREVGIE